MSYFVYVTFFKCLCDIILLHFWYVRPLHIFVVHRKGRVIRMSLLLKTKVRTPDVVVLTLVFHSNDIAVCHCFWYFAFWNWLMWPGSQ